MIAADARWALAGVLAVLAIAAAMYAPVVGFAYVWDDFDLFVHNTALHSGSLNWDELAAPVLPDTTYFRPVVLGTFAVQFQLFGPGPLASHAVNLALYLANVLLVAALAFAYVRRLGLPGMGWRVPLAALVYALHPALVESTAWVSGRFDQMVTLFVVAALLADVAIAKTWLRATVIAACFALALGSKELAVTLPLLLLLQRLALDGDRTRLVPAFNRALRGPANGLIWFLCTLVLAAYIVVRPHGFGEYLAVIQHAEGELATLPERALWVLQTVAFYLRQSLMPLLGAAGPSHPADPRAVYAAASLAQAAIGAAACIGIAVAALVCRAALGWLLTMWLGALALVLHIVPVPIGDNIGHDRFLTLPLVFVALAVGVIKVRIQALRPTLVRAAVALGVLGWTGLAAANVVIAVPMWKDDLTLWTWGYRSAPESVVARGNYLAALMQEDRADLMLPVLRELVENGTATVLEQSNYGYALMRTGRTQAGIAALEQLLVRLESDEPETGPEAKILERGGREGLSAFAHFLLAEGYLQTGRAEKSLLHADGALSIVPDNADGLTIKSVALEMLGQVEASESALTGAIEIGGPDLRAALSARREALRVQYRVAVQSASPAAP